MSYLKNLEIKQWLVSNPYSCLQKSLRKQAEDSWGKCVTGKNTCQWSTPLSESIFKEYLQSIGSKVIIRNKVYKSCSGKTLKPDFETENAIYELKCRSWNTQGTAGEKILGAPYKYSELPRLSGKPLYIVLMAYQEKDSFGVFDTCSPEKIYMTSNWRSTGIQFVKFTEMLNGLSLEYPNNSSHYLEDLECL